MTALLTAEGWVVNHKRVERIDEVKLIQVLGGRAVASDEKGVAARLNGHDEPSVTSVAKPPGPRE